MYFEVNEMEADGATFRRRSQRTNLGAFIVGVNSKEN